MYIQVKYFYAVFLIVCFSIPALAHSALLPRLGGLAYYDDVANLTWLADANAAKTSGYDANGLMTLSDANTWVTNLVVNGVSGWRLPTTELNDPSCNNQHSGEAIGYNCTGSELGNLFYNVLGGSPSVSITTTHNTNYDLFSNIESYYYWSKTEYLPNTRYAWNFSTTNGYQKINSHRYKFYAWAVISGDIESN